jgi:hypothetical protein
VEWQRAYGWILVGGQAMDRGFAVEGLTVTSLTTAGSADEPASRPGSLIAEDAGIPLALS